MHATKEMIKAGARAVESLIGRSKSLASNQVAEAAINAALAAMWQPIETAPRDGTEFQARIPGHGQDNVIAWDDNFECWAFTRDQEPPDCWTDGYCWESNEDLQSSVKPTHWMPLPPTPETK